MVKSRISVIVCSVAALWLVGCSSDKAAPSAAGSSTTIASAGTLAGATTTTAAGSGTTAVTTATAATVVSTSTTAAKTTTTTKTTATTTPAARVVTSPSDNVRLGDSGTGVEQIQTALKAHGYNIGVDGKFGSVTDKAVRDFQKKNGLKVDGIVGPKTWAKLQSSSTSTTGAATTTTKA